LAREHGGRADCGGHLVDARSCKLSRSKHSRAEGLREAFLDCRAVARLAEEQNAAVAGQRQLANSSSEGVVVELPEIAQESDSLPRSRDMAGEDAVAVAEAVA